MNKSEYYRNEYPLEELLPALEEEAEFVLSKVYTNNLDLREFEAFEEGFKHWQLTAIEMEAANLAAEQYRHGYEAAMEIIEKKLAPVVIKVL